jgi:hypothetical protein
MTALERMTHTEPALRIHGLSDLECRKAASWRLALDLRRTTHALALARRMERIEEAANGSSVSKIGRYQQG